MLKSQLTAKSLTGQALGAIVVAASLLPAVSFTIAAVPCQAASSEADAQMAEPDPALVEKIEVLKKQIAQTPQDAKVRFQYGKALLAVGNRPQAASEFLEATSLEPQLYVAYHQFTLCKPSNDQLDEAIERLNHLKNEHPDELMLRVALSEVLEQRGDCYAAARALIDLHYTGGVPEKLQPKVQARIHFLLSKTKDVNTAHSSQTGNAGLDQLQVPAPRSLAGKSKANDPTPGFGHSSLLP